MRKHITRLDDATIEQLLGAEDAENETDERFRQYFYFNKIFDNLNNDLPIRILVGHKGIGKSALLRRAYIGDRDRGRVAVSIKPSDLTEHRTATETSDFNLLVEQWKQGLLASIAAKIVEEVTKEHLSKTEALGAAKGVSGFLVRVAKLVLKHTNQRVDASSLVVGTFQEKSLVHVYIDDIDRGWAASPSDIRNISALLTP